MLSALSWPTSAGVLDPELPSVPFPSDEVVELPLLLPEWQVLALEDAAQRRNMTVGQLVRRMFSDAFPRALHRRG